MTRLEVLSDRPVVGEVEAEAAVVPTVPVSWEEDAVGVDELLSVDPEGRYNPRSASAA